MAGSKSRTAIGRRLAELRTRAGYTQRALAEALGVTNRTITYYELTAPRVPSDFLIAFAKLVGVQVSDILGEEGSEMPKPKNRQLRKRLAAVEKLPRKAQTALLEFLDALLLKYGAEIEDEDDAD